MSDDRPQAHNSTLRVPRERMKRGGPLPKRNARRKGHKYPHLVDEAYREYIRGHHCCVSVCRTGSRVECAHVRTRGAGHPDRGNCVPLCSFHHAMQHIEGIRSFQRRFSLDLAALAAELERQYPGNGGAW